MTSLAHSVAPHRAPRPERQIGLWLLVCATMVFAMAVLGAITRLSESGLSIMEWAPVSGILPPLSETEWQRLFALYKQIPEYRQDHADMTLAGFKTIFWWEYLHRLWGRLIGLVFAVPFVWFWATGRLGRRRALVLLGLFALGAAQGGLGWYMVASGFADRTDVSQYRLVAHLALALAIYGGLLWLALETLTPRARTVPSSLSVALGLFLALTGLTILSGGFVAGLNAGFIYNTFPLMGDQLVPPDYGIHEPWLANLFENPSAAQFNHRVLATTTLLAAIGLWIWARTFGPRTGRLVCPVALMAGLQLGLGIAALLMSVPVWLGAVHQAGALVLFGLALRALHQAASETHG